MGRLTPEKIKSILGTYEQTKSYIKAAKIEDCNWKTVRDHVKGVQSQREEDAREQASTGVPQAHVAYALFDKGKTLLQVSIELKVDADLVVKWRMDYWRLKGLRKLEEIYGAIGPNGVWALNELNELIEERNLDRNYCIETLQRNDSLEEKVDELGDTMGQLERRVSELAGKLEDEKKQLAALKKEGEEATRSRDASVKEIEQNKVRKTNLERTIGEREKELGDLNALVAKVESNSALRKLQKMVVSLLAGFLSQEGQTLRSLVLNGGIFGFKQLTPFSRYVLLYHDDHRLMEELARRQGFGTPEGYQKAIDKWLEQCVAELDQKLGSGILAELSKRLLKYARTHALDFGTEEREDGAAQDEGSSENDSNESGQTGKGSNKKRE